MVLVMGHTQAQAPAIAPTPSTSTSRLPVLRFRPDHVDHEAPLLVTVATGAPSSVIAKSKYLLIGGVEARIVGSGGTDELVVLPPVLRIGGTAHAELRDADQKVIAEGSIAIGTPPATAFQYQGSLVFGYVVLIVAFPFALLFTDILKAYSFAKETREDVIKRASEHGEITLDQLR